MNLNLLWERWRLRKCWIAKYFSQEAKSRKIAVIRKSKRPFVIFCTIYIIKRTKKKDQQKTLTQIPSDIFQDCQELCHKRTYCTRWLIQSHHCSLCYEIHLRRRSKRNERFRKIRNPSNLRKLRTKMTWPKILDGYNDSPVSLSVLQESSAISSSSGLRCEKDSKNEKK